MDTQNQYDIGVMGFWYGHNYGSILTYYALNKILTDMGNKVLMIEKPINRNDFETNEHCLSRKFARKHYNISEFLNFADLKDLNNLCHTFILGSDQVFNPGCYRPFKNSLFFDFAAPDKKKIAYGTSFGHSDLVLSILEKAKLKYFLSNFDAISVREQSGVNMLQKLGTNGDKVLDPIFLCPTRYYENLISETNINVSGPYILNYILDPTPAKRNLILNVSSKLNKNTINILDGISVKYEHNKKVLNLEGTTPLLSLPEFLAYYKKADFVITDSFHGTVCAIIFRKPFITIANRQRGLTRFESLLNGLNLKNRLVYKIENAVDNDEILQEINYDEVYKILEHEKNKSYNWLCNALKNTKEVKKQTTKDKLLKYFFSKQADNKFILYELLYYYIAYIFSRGETKKNNKICRDNLYRRTKKIIMKKK